MTPRGIRSTLPDNPREWHRRVWALSWPVILANLSIPLVGAAHTSMTTGAGLEDARRVAVRVGCRVTAKSRFLSASH